MATKAAEKSSHQRRDDDSAKLVLIDSSPDSTSIMAAIKALETGIYEKFDAHSTAIGSEILAVQEEMYRSLSCLILEVKAQDGWLTGLKNATSDWTTSLTRTHCCYYPEGANYAMGQKP